MKKPIIKIILEIAMALGFVALLSPAATGVVFHEVAAMILLVFVIIHILLNLKYIISMLPRLREQKTNYIVVACLIVSFLVCMISGILRSEVLFRTGFDNAIINDIHLWSAGLVIVLVGVHLGVCFDVIKGTVTKLTEKWVKKLSAKGKKRLAATLKILTVLAAITSVIGFCAVATYQIRKIIAKNNDKKIR